MDGATNALVEQVFLDALASLDFKLSLSDSPFFTASASTGPSDLFCKHCNIV